ncbi:hypothetical protein FOZ62_030138 [Perkinsus olseni]|uniref:Uncharacterized protein n=2 Tax=Perkinsus olseni TaxID=32597 RepID=A0A7J6TPL8_PEROL|nr:hypothetical protein FOZ62_030138 [Perkinsus olseni]
MRFRKDVGASLVMFEVLLTGFGVFVFGVTQGISAGYEVTRPFRVFGFTGLLAALSWRELRIGTHTKLERHTWTLRGRTSEYFDDSVAVSSPTYLVDNLPVYVLAFCFPFTTVGCGVWLVRRPKVIAEWARRTKIRYRRLFIKKWRGDSS